MKWYELEGVRCITNGEVACVCRFYRRDRDATNFEKKLLGAEAQVNDLQARLSDAVSQRKHWENEYNVSTTHPQSGLGEKQTFIAF